MELIVSSRCSSFVVLLIVHLLLVKMKRANLILELLLNLILKDMKMKHYYFGLGKCFFLYLVIEKSC
jgi:hypothetical protein